MTFMASAKRRMSTPIKALVFAAAVFATNLASFKAGSGGGALGGLKKAPLFDGSTTLSGSAGSSGTLMAAFNMGGGDVLAKRTFPVILDEQSYFIASPSLVVLPSGRILIVYERQAAWGLKNPKLTSSKLVVASDDDGASWKAVGSATPMQWPSIFTCASGTYMIGVQRHFTPDNQLVITKMLDTSGEKWSEVVMLSKGISAVLANTGVDVSLGRVTKAFETIPVLARPIKASPLTVSARIPIIMGPSRFSWRHPPTVHVTVEDSNGFTEHTLLKIPFHPHSLFFRVMTVDHSTNTLLLRLEKFTLFWITSDALIPKGAVLTLGSGANIYGAVDWVSVAMSADETQDLRDPKAWSYSKPLGNPASTRVQQMADLFDVAFRPDSAVRRSIVGFEPGITDYATALDAGFGSLYWMEGVVVRLQDRRGSSGKLLVTLRVNNDLFCDLAALVALDDSSLRTISKSQPLVTAKSTHQSTVQGRRRSMMMMHNPAAAAASLPRADPSVSANTNHLTGASRYIASHEIASDPTLVAAPRPTATAADREEVGPAEVTEQSEEAKNRLTEVKQRPAEMNTLQTDAKQTDTLSLTVSTDRLSASGRVLAKQKRPQKVTVVTDSSAGSVAVKDVAAEAAQRARQAADKRSTHNDDASVSQPVIQTAAEQLADNVDSAANGVADAKKEDVVNESSHLQAEFLRFKNVPGLAIGHPAILYDNVTDLYWMASNMNRDSTRVWRQPGGQSGKQLHITAFSSCEVDRTTMGLFYSGNAFDWWTAGILDYHLDFADHFTYPHMVIAGADLLVVMRATAPPVDPDSQTAGWYNNHNSNAVSFHRVANFRKLANVQWATWEGKYTVRPRSTSSIL